MKRRPATLFLPSPLFLLVVVVGFASSPMPAAGNASSALTKRVLSNTRQVVGLTAGQGGSITFAPSAQ